MTGSCIPIKNSADIAKRQMYLTLWQVTGEASPVGFPEMSGHISPQHNGMVKDKVKIGVY